MRQQRETFIKTCRKPYRGAGGGFTLVKVILSIAIVALLALMALTADRTAFAIFRRGAIMGANAEQAYAKVEQAIATGSGGSAATLSFRVGATAYTVSGRYYSRTSDGAEPNQTMTAFVPDQAH